MDEMMSILTDTATRLFEGNAGEEATRLSRSGTFPAQAWQAIQDAGLPLALLAEDEGGFGLDPADALRLVRIGGSFASPVPLGETMMANALLGRSGLPLAEGPATFARFDGELASGPDGWRIDGMVGALCRRDRPRRA
jgi:acyl-CoA dehydrogenase